MFTVLLSSLLTFVTAEQNAETCNGCAHFYFCSSTSDISVREFSRRIPEVNLSLYPIAVKGMDFGSDNVSMAGEHWLVIGMGFGSENISLT